MADNDNREELRKKALEKTRGDLKESVEKDRWIAKTVKFLDQNSNDFREEMERFREIYSLHFPELVKEITDDEDLVKILERGVKKDELDAFSSMAESSTGTDITDDERQMLENMVAHLKQKMEINEELESYIKDSAREAMPNLEALLGPLVAARLVSLSGGLDELAKSPASTIQVLGAEKALFRYLHGKGTPPKHGVLFQHEYVNSLPEEKRGKMARFLANKAAIAARLDNYGDKDKGEELREEAREKYESLQ
ncbi:MAG: hypothetical protein ABEJ99_01760 [Candidatus Nanohaloarchaea archaeon]